MRCCNLGIIFLISKMAIERIYFKKDDGTPCDFFDVFSFLGNCSRLEDSALSSDAQFGAEVDEGLICLTYYPEFFGVRKEALLRDIVSAGYQQVEK